MPVGVIPVWVDVLNTADRVNLLELYARSVMLLELGRAADWADLFGLNAQVCCAEPASARVGDTAAGARQFKGRTELLELARRMIAGEFDLAMGDLAVGDLAVGVVKTPARLGPCDRFVRRDLAFLACRCVVRNAYDQGPVLCL